MATWLDRFIAASGEALFPENDFGAPSWRDAELISRVHEYLGNLPATQRALVKTLFGAVEFGLGPLSSLRPRFSSLPAPRRRELVASWMESKVSAVALLSDAFKSTFTMLYMSHPDVMAYIGAYKVCARPEDPMPFRHDPDAFERTADVAPLMSVVNAGGER